MSASSRPRIASPENRALGRLSELTWRADDLDDFITMKGTLNPQAAKSLAADLSPEAIAALHFHLINNNTRVLMRKSCAVKIFCLEGLPLDIEIAGRESGVRSR